METPLKDMIESYIEYLEFPEYEHFSYYYDKSPSEEDLKRENRKYMENKYLWKTTKQFLSQSENRYSVPKFSIKTCLLEEKISISNDLCKF